MNLSITSDDCIFIMIDIQERLIDVMQDKETLLKNAEILNKATEILSIPLIVTEQYPEKLGKSVVTYPEKHKYFSKTRFSAFTKEVTEYINHLNKPIIIVYGIEAHICVTQTCLDALQKGYHVLLVADAISSRKEYSKEIAIKMLSDKGVELVTTEMILFRLLKDAAHPKFKEISKMIK